jgi:hypothetical protein
MFIDIFVFGGLGYKVFYGIVNQTEKSICLVTDSNPLHIIEFTRKNSFQLFTGTLRKINKLIFLSNENLH